MKLVRFGPRGQERPGIVVADGAIKDCSALVSDYDHAFFAAGGLDRLRAIADVGALPDAPAGVRLGAPVARPRNVFAIGLNYADHARETGAAIPAEPILFMKATTAVSGPHDPIRIPHGSTKTDWEVELGLVLGRDAHALGSPAEARGVVAGFLLANDVSERAFQLERGGQWSKGKSCPTFLPLGPWLVTSDEIGDPQALGLWLDVNGRRRQTGSTATMIFDVWTIVHYVSQFIQLEAGDVIITGTPPGVGMARTPPEFLRPGDVVELGIDGLGRQRSVCEQA
ncbi:MAG: fumarylacetoacetate hydrolase family protein [Pirellulales bacterium]|jgi:2-keto-4-pentenoate hydratase/2-oxohepta-3-ene-1,7-dioic acid hydratase in catechol pathway